MELNIRAGNWSKKPRGFQKTKGGSCNLLPCLLCLPPVAQESPPLSRDALFSCVVSVPILLCWSPCGWRSSTSQQRNSLGCYKDRETCAAKHLKKFSLAWHWIWWGFVYSCAGDWTSLTFFLQGLSVTKAQNIYWKWSFLKEMLFWMEPVCLENILNAKCCLTLKRFPFCHSLIRNVVTISIWNTINSWTNIYWGGWGSSHISSDLFSICKKIRLALATGSSY